MTEALQSLLHRDWSAVGVKRVTIEQTIGSGGNANLIGALAGKRHAVLGMFLVPSATITGVKLKTAIGGTDLTGPLALNATVPLILPFSPVPWLVCNENQSLNLLNGAASITYGGFILYVDRNP